MPDILFDWFSKYSRDHQNYLKVLHGFTESVISTRREEMQNDSETISGGSKKRKLAFLDLLLKIQLSGGDNPLTDQDIREEVSCFKSTSFYENSVWIRIIKNEYNLKYMFIYARYRLILSCLKDTILQHVH